MNLNETVAELKRRIATAMGIDPESYSFKWKGKALKGKDKLVLKEMGMQHKDHIEIVY